MNGLNYWFLTVLLACSSMLTASAEVDLSTLKVNTKPVKSSEVLIEQADLIVLGWPDVPEEEYPTNQTVEPFKVVNYVQTIHVKRVLKGSTPSRIKIVTAGINPLPDPSHPLNKMYPGPLAKENYVFFLKKLPESKFHTIIGGWQGIYPLFQGKIVSLENFGFKELNGLTVNQLEQKIKQLSNE